MKAMNRNYWKAIAAVALAVAAPLHAANITAVQSGNWNSDIWDSADPDTLPDPGLRPVNGDSALTSGAGISITLDSDVVPGGSLAAFQDRSSGGSLTVSPGGVLGWTGILEVIRSGTAGSITMTGGSLNGGDSSSIYVSRVQSTVNPAGMFSQSGGTVTTQTLRLTDVISGTGTPSGTYNLSGTGTLNITANLDPGISPATSTFSMTGGTLNYSGLRMNLTNAGGTLAPGGVGVVGTSFLHGVTGGPTGDTTTGQNYSQTSGTFAIDVASALSFDQLVGTGSTSGSNEVTLNGTLLVNMLGGFTPADGATFNIVTTGDIADSTIVDSTTIDTAGLASGSFTKAIIPGSGNSDILQLTYHAGTGVPEPASMALLSIGGLMLLRRRRTHVA